MRTRSFLLPLGFVFALATRAHEGMWLPTLLKSIEGDLQSAGLKLSAEDIYSINQGSIKDAIVLFGGGCTAEVISSQGLILTNHHCGFGAITDHSTLDHDYLKNGFWASDHAGELRNPGLTATFVVRMEDVTDRILPLISAAVNADEKQRRDLVAKLIEPIVADAIKGTHYKAVVRPFNYGNSYYLIVTETFTDVRLVGAPPSAIGKFGGDTDNWMWPRHTGDFSLFRIYAGPDNKPAEPSDANVPFAPRHVLPISMDGVQEGDYAMIFGFPGQTQRYLSSYGVDYVINTADPMRIAMRTASLGVIDAAMHSSDALRLMYADKQSSIANAWKKWIGEVRGLKELNTLERKKAYELEYQQRATAIDSVVYVATLGELARVYAEVRPYATARDAFVEMAYYGPDMLEFANGFESLVENQQTLIAEGKFDAAAAEAMKGAEGFFANYDAETDKRIFKALLPLYRKHVPAELAPEILKEIDTKYKGNADAWGEAIYARSVFADHARLKAALKKPGAKAFKKLMADPGYRAARSFFRSFTEKVRPQVAAQAMRIENMMRTYVKGMMVLYPDKTYWPDANSTLRLSYGKVEGSTPRDAVTYTHYTTLDGIMEKHMPGDADFEVPARLVELHKTRDYGPYGVNSTMPVCFTSSLHTTGGNSGSPVLNGRGELIGLNFDRTWESTMSDIQFDPDKCRNICMDVRYLLFIIDKYAGAKHIVAEMTLVKQPEPPPMIQLPIHR